MESAPSELPEEPALLTPSFWVSVLLKCGRIHVCCLSHTVCDHLSWGLQKTNTSFKETLKETKSTTLSGHEGRFLGFWFGQQGK